MCEVELFPVPTFPLADQSSFDHPCRCFLFDARHTRDGPCMGLFVIALFS
jgi:hypothetical protein